MISTQDQSTLPDIPLYSLKFYLPDLEPDEIIPPGVGIEPPEYLDLTESEFEKEWIKLETGKQERARLSHAY